MCFDWSYKAWNDELTKCIDVENDIQRVRARVKCRVEAVGASRFKDRYNYVIS